MTNERPTLTNRGVYMGPIRRLFRRTGPLLAAATLLLAGCSSLVEYEEKDVITPDALGATGAEALTRNARRSFAWATEGDGGGGTEGTILVSGLLSDEFFHSGTFSTRVDVDQRITALDNSTQAGVFRQLQTARTDAVLALDALNALEGFDPATDSRVSELNNYMGAVFLIAAQDFCSGIPFSVFQDGVLVPGEQLTTQQMIDSAVVYFDRALAGAAGTGNANHYCARLQKARALTMLGRNRLGDAAALVGTVPTSYKHESFHAEVPSTLRNGVYVFNVQNERWSLAHKEGGNGLPFRGAGDGKNPALADPRVPWKRDAGDVGFDGFSEQYDLQIYKTRTDNSVFLRGVEARLIEAELDLQTNPTAWLAKLNALRATVAGLAPLTDPGNTNDRVKLHFSERAFWLFATGTRVMDLRRMVRQYSFAAESIWPTGTFGKGGVYGPDVNLPVPDTEKQNPTTGGKIECLDRSA
jgi:starch-binding outer membrane protein, SusD/RagB family